jgi:enoyl-CoA hydratase/carnithine racemase
VIELTKDGHVATLRLNRPEAGNSLTRAMRPMMAEMWADVRDDRDVRVVIVTGTGDRHFCTGIDVREAAATGGAPSGFGSAREEIPWSPLHHDVWKPIICAVNGTVAGGGLHFVADADIVVAADHVEFLDTHVNVGMVGAVENIGLTHRLPLGTVMRMTLCGSRFRLTAARAHALGLVDELVPADALMTTAIGIASDIAANSPAAVQLSKQAVWSSLGRPLPDAAEYGWALARMHRQHPDYTIGPRAFAERRSPEWFDAEPQ